MIEKIFQSTELQVLERRLVAAAGVIPDSDPGPAMTPTYAASPVMMGW